MVAVSLILGYTAAILESKFLDGCREVTWFEQCGSARLVLHLCSDYQLFVFKVEKYASLTPLQSTPTGIICRCIYWFRVS